MKLLLSTTRRVALPQWVCRSCQVRGISRNLGPVPAACRSERRVNNKLDGPIRTRFAPSPTGYLHLGSLRTALFNYLIAKASGGQFLLRIEDTDQTRTVPDAEERLFQDLEWAGIKWDEGPRVGGNFGPYKQSERLPIYREHVDKLLQSGHAYRCYCTVDQLKEAAALRHRQGLPPRYDGHCKQIAKEESDDRAAKGEVHAVRFLSSKISARPLNDLNYGFIRPEAKDKSGDIILLKQDGFPTYHLANVVDDHLMEITHVIRGSEWLSSTPKHALLYSAFGWEPPKFCHVSLLVDENKQKLSKRMESINIDELRKNGIFPEALINYVALLGWSHKNKSDLMDMRQLVAEASFKFTKDDCTVSLEKLWFLQKKHAIRYAAQDDMGLLSPLADLAVKPILQILDGAAAADRSRFRHYRTIPVGLSRLKYIHSIIREDVANYITPSEFIARNLYFFDSPSADTLKGKWAPVLLHIREPNSIPPIQTKTLLKLFPTFQLIPDWRWTFESIKEHTKGIVEQGIQSTIHELDSWQREGSLERKLELQKLLQHPWIRLVHSSIRWALVGGMPGLDGAKAMFLLGRAESLRRLEMAWDILSDMEENESFGSMNSMPSHEEADVKAMEIKQITKSPPLTKPVTIMNKENEAFGSLDG